MVRSQDIIMFGVRYHDNGRKELVFIDDIPLEQNGQKCELYCSKCGGKLEAVRKHKGDVQGGFAFLRHASGGKQNCTGHSEGIVHMLAKKLLLASKGQRFMLPPVYWKDGIAHISRFTSNGKWKSFANNRSNWSYMAKNSALNKMFAENSVCTIENVFEESDDENAVPEGMRADIVLTLKTQSGISKNVAVEIRDTHQKDIQDVTNYAKSNMSVIEISVGDLDPKDRHLKKHLWERVLGIPYDKSSKMREWLYNDAVGKYIEKNMCWRITKCSDYRLITTISHYLNFIGLGHLTSKPPNTYKDSNLQWQLYNIQNANAPIVDKHMWCYDKINDNIMYLAQADAEITYELCYDKNKNNQLELNGIYDIDMIRYIIEVLCSEVYGAAHNNIIYREEDIKDYEQRMRAEVLEDAE